MIRQGKKKTHKTNTFFSHNLKWIVFYENFNVLFVFMFLDVVNAVVEENLSIALIIIVIFDQFN